jgi:hypothetical protein
VAAPARVEARTAAAVAVAMIAVARATEAVRMTAACNSKIPALML